MVGALGKRTLEGRNGVLLFGEEDTEDLVGALGGAVDELAERLADAAERKNVVRGCNIE